MITLCLSFSLRESAEISRILAVVKENLLVKVVQIGHVMVMPPL